MRQFTDKADFQIRFQPFQLYPNLPRLHPEGADKQGFFKELGAQRNPEANEEAMRKRFGWLQNEWQKDGLKLSDRGGNIGNSFDAQRLIFLARKQGVEDQVIEAIYTANHENNLCLSNRSVLLACAEKAGVKGAEQMLNSQEGMDEVMSKIQAYQAMGVTQVPVLIFNDKFPIEGAPDRRTLEVALKGLVEKGDQVEWPPVAPPFPQREFVSAAQAALKDTSDEQEQKWSKHKLDWSDGDPRWPFLEERILKCCSASKTFGEGFSKLQEALRSEVGPRWSSEGDLALRRPALASSEKSPERAAALAVDGNSATRWTSVYEDEQWLSVDLGAVCEISRIEICWEAAHAKSYLLQGSDDGKTWSTWATEAGHEGWVLTSLPKGCAARWVRMLGLKRATSFGFSIWELRVFGQEDGAHVESAGLQAAPAA
mmetsp:Transcript_120203/g.256532  ORF Transcript_120203/g.256532 Transcript_120203/m.256532 type:complete len:427 (+) Transcript_120203:266-1546(+)